MRVPSVFFRADQVLLVESPALISLRRVWGSRFIAPFVLVVGPVPLGILDGQSRLAFEQPPYENG